jgi:hypothetical protein
MSEEPQEKEPFAFWLVRQFLEPDEDGRSESEGISDRELYSTFAFVIITLSILALTVGPFSLLH